MNRGNPEAMGIGYGRVQGRAQGLLIRGDGLQEIECGLLPHDSAFLIDPASIYRRGNPFQGDRVDNEEMPVQADRDERAIRGEEIEFLPAQEMAIPPLTLVPTAADDPLPNPAFPHRIGELGEDLFSR